VKRGLDYKIGWCRFGNPLSSLQQGFYNERLNESARLFGDVATKKDQVGDGYVLKV
jgi:hypothetical protein